jgi:hypothetical protein
MVETIRAIFKWLRSWQHSTMSRRISFLLSLIDNRHLERRFQFRVAVLRWALLAILLAALFAIGREVGWDELKRSL